MIEVAERVAAVRARIANACANAGRPIGSVTIVAAAKTRTAAEINAVIEHGITDIGENTVQEWLGTRDACPDARWHFIGALQRNKVNKVAGQVALVHGLADPAVADALSARCVRIGVIQPVLLQVNVSAEPGKSGVRLDEAAAAARRIAALPGVLLCGLFGIPAPSDPGTGFARLRDLGDQLMAQRPGVVELSMGMSDDLELAIAHGATIVRPGTALFGPRPPMP